MKRILDNIYKNQSLVYKVIAYLAMILALLYLFPREGKFKYAFQKGKPWQYDNLYAPFDFPIHKTSEEIEREKDEIAKSVLPYYNYNTAVYVRVASDIENQFSEYIPDTVPKTVLPDVLAKVKQMYQRGVVVSFPKNDQGKINLIRRGNQFEEASTDTIFKLNGLNDFITKSFNKAEDYPYKDAIYELLFAVLKPNVEKNVNFTNRAKQEALSKVSYTRGTVDKGKRIIVKGEVVEGDKYVILDSLKQEYKSQLWSENNYSWVIVGYVMLIALTLLMLLLFLRKYRFSIYNNNTKITFIFLNILLMVFLTTFAMKYNVQYIYIVPLAILPIVLKAFFDARVGLFVHVLTTLLLGFVVPNSFEYIYLQIITGVVSMLTVTQLYKRASLFISVGQITMVYLVAYFAFYIITEGSFEMDKLTIFSFFLLNGLITVVSAQSLIYIYEKLFGLDSDVSLLELSDTNSKLLRELSEKAPGTFHHCLQVANLAEAAATEIGANALLVRVGALYHDIGKMNVPTFFTENQKGTINPHDELDASESAAIIINHVIDGITLAKKNNLPDRIIDFIRTHHGTSLVYYFYKKQLDMEGTANEEDFRYPGPVPFSKETAILMMSDSVEAASKSLKNPTYSVIDAFVEKIINKQLDEGQFLNADITLKEIEKIKKILKQKLVNIYHLRIEYPE